MLLSAPYQIQFKESKSILPVKVFEIQLLVWKVFAIFFLVLDDISNKGFF